MVEEHGKKNERNKENLSKRLRGEIKLNQKAVYRLDPQHSESTAWHIGFLSVYVRKSIFSSIFIGFYGKESAKYFPIVFLTF